MLVLTRKPSESIVVLAGLNTVIELTVMSVRGNQVRIGVDAPKEIPVHRREVYNRIHHEKEATTRF